MATNTAEPVRHSPCRGWIPLILFPPAIIACYPSGWPRWGLMWGLAITIYYGCKWLTWRRTPLEVPAWRHFAYLFAWPGMDAASFLGSRSNRVGEPDAQEWLFALAKFLMGLLLFFGVARVLPADSNLVRGWIGIAGLAFIFHFGIFHILSCLWRSMGIAAVPLMEWPIASRNVADFWGKRWNHAFRDLTSRFLFRPLARRFGGPASLVLGFLVSGLIHDAVISLPAEDGYGRPTLYFLIQGLGVLFSHSVAGRSLGIHGGILGWMFACVVVVVPVGLLFHPPFLTQIMVPFMHFMGAMP